MKDFHRPFYVTVISGIFVLLGIAAIISALIMQFTDISFVAENKTDGAIVSSVILGAIMIIIGFCLLRGMKTFWYVGIIFVVVGIAFNAYVIYSGQNYFNIANGIAIILNLVILNYIVRPSVKSFFDV